MLLLLLFKINKNQQGLQEVKRYFAEKDMIIFIYHFVILKNESSLIQQKAYYNFTYG